MIRQAAAPLAVGDLVAGRYRVEHTLGEGGMGVVYAVKDESSGLVCAMKVLLDAADEAHVTRLLREGRAIAKIDSAHVVRVLDTGAVGGIPYVVMERLEGRSLREELEGGALPERRVADLAIQACEGLAHAHAHGIVHRDIKPSNLFVTDRDDGPELKILDFGISRMTSLDEWEQTAVTASHSLLGSPHYASPEQLQDPRSVDGRTDIWSLGVSIYLALCGHYPFDGRSLAEVLVAVMSRRPTPYADHGVSPSEAMQSAIARCLDRSLERRFADVGELATALAPLASPRIASLAPLIVEICRAPRVIASVAPPAPSGPSDRTLTVDVPIPPPPRLPSGGAGLPSLQATSADLAEAVPASSSKQVHRRTGFALAGLAALATILVGTYLVRPAPADGDAQPSEATPSLSTPASAPPSTSDSPEPAPIPHDAGPVLVRLELAADGRITKIIKPASPRRVALEDGKAWIEVSPQSSDMEVEVELGSGAIARGIARVGGPTALQLRTVPTARNTRPPRRPPARPARSSKPAELQGSPYGSSGSPGR